MNILAAVKQYALDHYEEDGWDIVVECYGDEEILAIIGKKTEKSAIAAVKKHVRPQYEYRREIQAEAF